MQETAVRRMPRLASVVFRTFSLAMGAQKLGQPVPGSNFVSELNRALLQQIAAADEIPRVWLLPRTLRFGGLNLYGHPKRIVEFSSNFHPPRNLVASRLFRATGAAFGRI